MKYWYQKPNLLLEHYIRTVLILESTSAPVNNKLPLFTEGMPVLICRSEKEKAIENIVDLSLYGNSAPSLCWAVEENTTVIAYVFKPFTMASIFNLAAAKLKKGPVALSDWDAHVSNALRTQLAHAGSTREKLEVLDHLLIQQLKHRHHECEIIREATDHMMFQVGTGILSQLMDRLKVNQRTFQRMFKKYVGVSPDHYRRICQFQLSFAQLRAGEFNKLTDVAYENGFSDQSHFIRAFKEFTQTTPHDYLRSGLGPTE